MNDEMNIGTDIAQLTKLLEETIGMFRENRAMAKKNHENLRDQLDNILAQGLEGSEESRLEKELNISLKLVFESGSRMEAVIESLTKILIASMNNESRERVASNIFGGNFGQEGKRLVTGKVDLKALLNDQREDD